MYQVTETNVQIQLGNYSSTFTLVDDSGVMPEVILEKNFNDDPNIATIVSNCKIIDALNWTNIYLAGQSNG